MYHQPLDSGGLWATTAVFGHNVEREHGDSNAFLLETNLDLDGLNVLFGRVEYVQKTGDELVLTEPLADEIFDIGALSLGYLRNFGPLGPVLPGVGACGTVDLVPKPVGAIYGSRTPVGGMVYVRLASAPMRHAGHGDSR
jgi:hypothetical protein